jgi:tellurite resistance protein TerC
MDRFHYLKVGISAILIFIGIKMAVSGWYKLPTLAALAVIIGVLGIAVAASLLRPRDEVAPATD